MLKHDVILGGFNSKFYDDWISQSIIGGADNETVFKHNEFIIKKKENGWNFPFISFQKKEFKSFDLKDDLPANLSLKAIEGNMGANIKESDVSFDIGRKLTGLELTKVIDYCKADVDNTVDLYHERQSYIDSKRTVAKIKGMDETEAITLTNAKLTAKFLEAKKRTYTDEFEYTVPQELDIGRYQHVIEFFLDPVNYTIKQLESQLENEKNKTKRKRLENKIEKHKKSDRYDCQLTTDIAGVPHVFAWGGLHGAKKNYHGRSEDGYKIVTIDVGSYYPSLMIEYDYMSRSIPSPDGFKEVYHTRMKAKRDGDKPVANALKLILNTCYGAMKNQYNDLYDPKQASAVCITGQLLLTDLIDKLEDIETFELIQSNTDGIIIKYHVDNEQSIESVVSDWEKRTRMNMEYTLMHVIAQKDVNNYIMKAGETYVISDGKKVVTDEDEGSIKSKGGYVSLYRGGGLNNNSMAITHKALGDYLLEGVPIDQTINDSSNLVDFQIIAKTGSTYDGTHHEVNGEAVPVQKVNRVFASNKKEYRTIYKTKANGRKDKIASLPDHCIIDNENKLTIDDVDKSFYIELTKKRAQDYVGKKSAAPKKQTKKSEVTKMATAKKMNIYEKLLKARLDFLNANVKKTGVNRFAEYKYFELSDIVPTATNICEQYGLVTLFDFNDELASLTVVDIESAKSDDNAYPPLNHYDKVVFNSPMRTLAVKGMNEIQALGGVETYQRRYLYMMFLDIVEADAFDATNGKKEEDKPDETKSAPKKSNRPASPTERKEAKDQVIDKDGQISEVQIKSIKNGLKKLRAKSSDNEPFIKETLVAIKKGMSKKEAEDMLIEIGEKIKGDE